MRFLIAASCILCLTGCISTSAEKSQNTVPRAAPGYLYWMQKESMLGGAPALISQVSQTQKVWLQSSEPARADVLLKAAPNWLELAAIPSNPKSPYFVELAKQVKQARAMGFSAIFLGPTGENPDIWAEKDGSTPARTPASFNFDASFGSDRDFAKLAAATEENKLELGSDLLSGATGRGPDFFLQARNAPEYAGLYAMLPVPAETESILPLTHEEWDCQVLSPTAITELAEAGVLPPTIARDKLDWTSKGGWAATGPVIGVDGVPRRWVYRFSEHPSQPALSWQDPSGASAKILHAAVIRHTGILGQSLAALHFEPLMALEPSGGFSLSPGMSALNEVARQIHRYGGWALQADPLPLRAIQEVLRGPCDFCRDDITPLLVAYGLIMDDGRPIAKLYRDLIANGTDIGRLAHGFNSHKGLKPALLQDNPDWVEQAQRLSELGSSFNFKQLFNQVYHGRQNKDEIEKMRRFLLCWRLGLPGLSFIEFYPGSLIKPTDGWLEHTLTSRSESGLAVGKVIEVIRGVGGTLGILSKLPNGGFWLMICNFGRFRAEITARLPSNVHSAIDASDARSLITNLNGNQFRLALDGKEAKNIIFEAKSAKIINSSLHRGNNEH